MTCARLSWPYSQLLGTRKYTAKLNETSADVTVWLANSVYYFGGRIISCSSLIATPPTAWFSAIRRQGNMWPIWIFIQYEYSRIANDTHTHTKSDDHFPGKPFPVYPPRSVPSPVVIRESLWRKFFNGPDGLSSNQTMVLKLKTQKEIYILKEDCRPAWPRAWLGLARANEPKSRMAHHIERTILTNYSSTRREIVSHFVSNAVLKLNPV